MERIFFTNLINSSKEPVIFEMPISTWAKINAAFFS
jgi:hypothetical protein